MSLGRARSEALYNFGRSLGCAGSEVVNNLGDLGPVKVGSEALGNFREAAFLAEQCSRYFTISGRRESGQSRVQVVNSSRKAGVLLEQDPRQLTTSGRVERDFEEAEV